MSWAFRDTSLQVLTWHETNILVHVALERAFHFLHFSSASLFYKLASIFTTIITAFLIRYSIKF